MLVLKLIVLALMLVVVSPAQAELTAEDEDGNLGQQEISADSDPGPVEASHEEGLDYKDSVKLVLEDFELSILKSESLQLNATNDTRQNLTEALTISSQRPKLSCLPSHHVAEGEVAVVSLVNGTELQAGLLQEQGIGHVNPYPLRMMDLGAF